MGIQEVIRVGLLQGRKGFDGNQHCIALGAAGENILLSIQIISRCLRQLVYSVAGNSYTPLSRVQFQQEVMLILGCARPYRCIHGGCIQFQVRYNVKLFRIFAKLLA